MKYSITASLLITFFFACVSPKKAIPSAISVVSLQNYQLNPGISFNNDINYSFIGHADTFYKMFSMTKASVGTAIVPDFSAQSVVAIVLKPTEKVLSVEINKAEITGENLNIYYTTTDTTTWKTYLQIPMVVATVPKSLSVKQVNFYNHGNREKTIAASY